MLRALATGMLAIVWALHGSAAQAQVAYLNFGATPADLHARAVQMFEAETGGAVAPGDVLISPADISGDGQLDMIAYARTPFFCNDQGCEPRIYLFDGQRWRNVLEPGLVRTQEVPGAFSLVNVSRTGFSDILAGSTLLVFDGTYYVEETPPAPTELDMDGFSAACADSPHTAALVLEAGGSPGAEELCACVGALFGHMGMDQEDLDAAAASYRDPATPIGSDLAAILDDYELSCRVELAAG